MKIQLGWLIAVSMGVSVLGGQNANDTPEAHIALAKTAAGDDYRNLFNFLCAVPGARGGGQRGAPGGVPGAAAAPGTPNGAGVTSRCRIASSCPRAARPPATASR